MAVIMGVHRESIGSMLGCSNWNAAGVSFGSFCLFACDVCVASCGCYRSYKDMGPDRMVLESSGSER